MKDVEILENEVLVGVTAFILEQCITEHPTKTEFSLQIWEIFWIQTQLY